MGQIVAQGEQFETYIAADHRGQILRSGPDSGEIDAFGRLRVSAPFTLFDSTMRFDKRPDQWYEVLSGSASATFLPYESSVALTTTTASGDTALRRTKQSFPYQAGKSLNILQSFVGNTPTAGLIQEAGYFDNNNGVMVRASGTTIQFVVRSIASGTVRENIVNQSDWNIDTYPNFDFAKAQILTTDLEWLGVGRVRCGFIVDGEIRYCHEFNHANIVDSVYMQTAILPLSVRIHNATAQSAPRTIKQVCCSILSEGGYEPDGATYSVVPPLAGLPNTSGERLSCAIRMASGRTGNVILPTKIDTAAVTSDVVIWRLRLNPTMSGVAWLPADNGRGNVETTVTGTCSGGTVVNLGMVSQGSAINLSIDVAIRLALGTNAVGASDILALTVDSAVNSKAIASLGWVEIT